MGYIRIITGGSFPNRDVSFSAMDHGHADAVAKAMEWLALGLRPCQRGGGRRREGWHRPGLPHRAWRSGGHPLA